MCEEIITRSCSAGTLNTDKYNIEVLFREGPGSKVGEFSCRVSIGFGVTTAAYMICLYAVTHELDTKDYDNFVAAAPLLRTCLRVFGLYDPAPTLEEQVFKTIRGIPLQDASRALRKSCFQHSCNVNRFSTHTGHVDCKFIIQSPGFPVACVLFGTQCMCILRIVHVWSFFVASRPGKCDASNRQRPNVLQMLHAFSPVVEEKMAKNPKLDPTDTLSEVPPISYGTFG